MAAYGLFLALIMAMRLAPESALGRMLNRHLVERPLDWLGEIDRRQVLYAVILTALCLGSGEAVAILGSEFLTIYAWDMAVYLDAVAVTYALAAAAKARMALRWVRLRSALLFRRFRRLGRRAKRARTTMRRSSISASNDDDAGAMPALAA